MNCQCNAVGVIDTEVHDEFVLFWGIRSLVFGLGFC